jgi:hypothetical protein
LGEWQWPSQATGTKRKKAGAKIGQALIAPTCLPNFFSALVQKYHRGALYVQKMFWKWRKSSKDSTENVKIPKNRYFWAPSKVTKERARNNLPVLGSRFSSCKARGGRIAGLLNRRVKQQGGKKAANMGMLFRAHS